MPGVVEAIENLDTGKLQRSKLLKLVGGAIFAGAAGWAARAEPALAQHELAEYPCFDYHRCHYCDGAWCNSYCWWPHTGGHCFTKMQFWEDCWNGTRWRCRDWHEQFPGLDEHHCVCRGAIGSC
jgi:hypothetical protein